MESSKYTAGIMTVPERYEACEKVRLGLAEKGIPYHIFVDFEHRGEPFNYERMLAYYSLKDTQGKRVILTTDDILFKDGWLDRVEDIMSNSDYDMVCLYTNTNAKKTDEYGVFHATSKFFMYDPCIVFREGMLDENFIKGFRAYAGSPERTIKETHHYDNMLSSFLIAKGYKCGIVRPNMVALQDVKSTLGHNIVSK